MAERAPATDWDKVEEMTLALMHLTSFEQIDPAPGFWKTSLKGRAAPRRDEPDQAGTSDGASQVFTCPRWRGFTRWRQAVTGRPILKVCSEG